MVTVKFIALLTVAAVVAFASSAVVSPGNDDNRIDDSTLDSLTSTSVPDLTDDEDDGVRDRNDDNIVIEGVPFKYMSEEEKKAVLDEQDESVVADLDFAVIKTTVIDRIKKGDSALNAIAKDENSVGRRKRWVAPLLRVAAALFRGSVRTGVTRSGIRRTHQYTRPGNYRDAVRDFNKFRPQNQKTFTTRQGISGRTGTVGNHRITVRNGSSNGSPTLEIRTPKSNGETVRKFRYGQK